MKDVKGRVCRKHKGFTLVEAVVSVAILAILSMMFVSAMAVCISGVKTTRTRTANANSAAGQVEAKRAAGDRQNADQEFTINFGGKSYTVSGSYVNGTDNNISYKEFVPTANP